MRSHVLIILLFCSGYAFALDDDSTNDPFLENYSLANFDALNHDGGESDVQSQDYQSTSNPDLTHFVESYAAEFSNEEGKIDLGINNIEQASSLLRRVSKENAFIEGISNSAPHGQDFFESINKGREDATPTSAPTISATSDEITTTSTEIRSVKPGNIIKISPGGNLRHSSVHETTVAPSTSHILFPIDLDLMEPSSSFPTETKPSSTKMEPVFTQTFVSSSTREAPIPSEVQQTPPSVSKDHQKKPMEEQDTHIGPSSKSEVQLDPTPLTSEISSASSLTTEPITSTIQPAPTLETKEADALWYLVPSSIPALDELLEPTPSPKENGLLIPEEGLGSLGIEEQVKQLFDRYMKAYLQNQGSNLQEHNGPSSEANDSDMEKHVKKMFKEFLREHLGGESSLSKSQQPINPTTEVTVTGSITQVTTSSAVTTSLKSSSYKTTQETNPVTVSDPAVIQPTNSAASTQVPTPMLESPESKKMPSLDSKGVLGDFDLENLVKDITSGDKLDIDVNKLKLILGNLLGSDAIEGEKRDDENLEASRLSQSKDSLSDNSKSVEDPLETSLLEFSQLEKENESENYDLDDQENLSTEISDDDYDDENGDSSDDENLQNLGLKDYLEESKETNRDKKGSFWKTLKDIPRNVMDLVDERHGEEYGFKDKNKVGQVEEKDGKRKINPSKSGKENKQLSTQKRKEAALDASIKDRTSLNKIAKPQNGKTKSSDTSSLPPEKDQDEDDYKQFHNGKLVFDFDKKKKKTSRKLEKAKQRESGTDDNHQSDDEVEYYRPEDYLFSKSSTGGENDSEEHSEKSPSKNIKPGRGNTTTSLRENVEKATNGTRSPLTKVLDLLEEGDEKDESPSLHNDPYSIPKVPAEHLKEMENAKSQKPGAKSNKPLQKDTQKVPASKTSAPTGDKTSKNPLDLFKKTPSLLFNNKHSQDSDAAFDFTRSEAVSNKLISWSIMGAAILLAMSMVLI